jgi:hypothetical protein
VTAAAAATVTAAVLGFALLMGGIIASMMAAGTSGVETETSLPAMKAAWRSGDWRREPQWRRLFVIAGGAALLTVGLFGTFIAIAPIPVKVICAGAILYPAIRLTLALRRA